jgi:hypothetical protein
MTQQNRFTLTHSLSLQNDSILLIDFIGKHLTTKSIATKTLCNDSFRRVKSNKIIAIRIILPSEVTIGNNSKIFDQNEFTN